MVLQCFGFTWSSPQPTPLPTGHLLSAPPLDESVEPSGPYPELVGCLIPPYSFHSAWQHFFPCRARRFCPAQHAIVLLPCHAQRATALPAKTRLPDARAARALPARCPRTARVARTLPTLTARLSHAARAARTLPARRPHCLVPPALPARCWPAVRCPAHRIARVACMRPA
ncbi:unnamed protein product [Closterium sp. NIES-54]